MPSAMRVIIGSYSFIPIVLLAAFLNGWIVVHGFLSPHQYQGFAGFLFFLLIHSSHVIFLSCVVIFHTFFLCVKAPIHSVCYASLVVMNCLFVLVSKCSYHSISYTVTLVLSCFLSGVQIYRVFFPVFRGTAERSDAILKCSNKLQPECLLCCVSPAQEYALYWSVPVLGDCLLKYFLPGLWQPLSSLWNAVQSCFLCVLFTDRDSGSWKWCLPLLLCSTITSGPHLLSSMHVSDSARFLYSCGRGCHCLHWWSVEVRTTPELGQRMVPDFLLAPAESQSHRISLKNHCFVLPNLGGEDSVSCKSLQSI